MTKNTPGPWHVIGKHVAYRRENIDLEIAEVSLHVGEDEYLANARLIAAAPDLLKACETILYCVEEIIVIENTTRTDNIFALLNNAVQKARGNQKMSKTENES